MPDFIDEGPLPEFDDPPVVETVLSVQFRELPKLGVAQIIRFWERELAAELPEVEQQPPYNIPIERFGDEFDGGPVRLAIAQDFPSPRFWFSSGSDLVQIQPDWFAYNWRKARLERGVRALSRGSREVRGLAGEVRESPGKRPRRKVSPSPV